MNRKQIKEHEAELSKIVSSHGWKSYTFSPDGHKLVITITDVAETDDQGKPTKVPPLMLTSDHEREFWEQGKRRYQTCKGEIMSEDAEYKVCREEPMVFD